MTINGTSSDDTLTGTVGDDTLDGLAGSDTLIGLAGNDFYIFDRLTDVAVETPGNGRDTVRIAFANSTNAAMAVDMSLAAFNDIEDLVFASTGRFNAIGNALDNFITGNASTNFISAHAGNDTLDGAGGADILNGGDGDDIYYVDNIGDIVDEGGGLGAGIDTVIAKVSIQLLSGNVENLTLAGTAGLAGVGNIHDNTILGNAGANKLDGGLGADDMTGGQGNDTFYIDNAADIVHENVGEGTDLLFSSISYSLAGVLYAENLTLTGTGNNDATGNAVKNTLTGNAGNNRLDGGGGTDKMAGGAGDDTFVVDNAADLVSDTSGADTIEASVNYTLVTGIERLVLTGTSVVGTGNTANNTLVGNNLNNTLNGGTGNDTMAGGLGDDTYIANATSDVVQEVSGEGHDTVQSAASYTLSANLEALVLTGVAALNGTGNGEVNTITGNTGANTLDGGVGADILAGGLGKDTYIIDDVGDTIVETSALATEADTVRSLVDFTLGANLEHLVMMVAGHSGGGNALNNTMTGSAGTDTLSGAAGKDRLLGNAGNDTLDGGTGNDVVLGGDGDDRVILDLRTDVFIANLRQDKDTLDGGNGADTLVMRLTNAQNLDPNILNAISAVQNAINTGNVTAFTNAALGLRITSFSTLQVIADPAPNSAPTDISLDTSTMNENDVAAIIGNLTATDADAGDTHTYTVNDARFEVVAGQLKLKAGQTLNFETSPSVTVQVSATDRGGLSFSKDFTVTVNDVNEAPVNIAISNSSLNENAAGAAVGTLATTDPDAGNIHVYTVDDPRFEVVAGQLRLKPGQALDFEAEPSVTVRVTATDLGGLSFDKYFTITVNNVNEAPSDIALSSAFVTENSVAAIIGNVSVSDPDAASTHSFAVDDSRFQIVAGQLKLKAGQSVNFENAPTITVRVTATDQGGLSFGKDFTITVNDVNETPTNIFLTGNSVNENDIAAVIGDLTVSDPDVANTHTFTVDDARFEVVSGQLKLKAGQSLNFENSSSVTVHVTATDQGGLAFGKDFTIAVNNINELPTNISLSNSVVNENAVAAVIGNLTASDPDSANTHTYTVDDARFEVVAGQLKLKAGQSLNFETEPSVALHITTTDQGGLSFGKDFTVTVSNVNDAPVNITLSNANVSENAIAVAIGNLTTSDPDVGNTHTYVVDDSRFEVIGGQLKLKTGQSLNFETEPSVTLHVTATDQGGLSFGKDFTVTVNNINEAPTNISLSNVTVNEGTAGAVIGVLTTTDADAGDAFSYTVDDNRFEIVAGQLKLKDGQSLNFGTEPTVDLHISSTDLGSLGFGKDFTISVVNLAGPFLFTAALDSVDFNALSPGAYDSASFYDALGGNDVITLPDAPNAALLGYNATNTFYANSGEDTVDGGGLNDIISGGLGNDLFFGFGGDDTLDGGVGSDTIRGNAGNDTYVFKAGDGSDIVDELGSGTQDTLLFKGINPGDVRLWTDTDSLFIQYTASDIVEVGGISNGGNDVGTIFERISFEISPGNTVTWDITNGLYLFNKDSGGEVQGSRFNDTITGGTGVDTITAFGGDDTLEGGSGNDTIVGNGGNDTYVFKTGDGSDFIEEFGSGTDTILFKGIDPASVRLWTDVDSLFIQYTAGEIVEVGGISNGGNDVGTIFERISFEISPGNTVTWDITNGLYLFNNDTGRIVYGSRFNDTVIGGAGIDTLEGYAGDDTLDGGAGADVMNGGDGNDYIIVNIATDTVSGGNGIDTVQSSVTLTLTADAENLVLAGASGIHGTGNGLANTLTGNGGSNSLDGGAGADTMNGGNGNDTFIVDNALDVTIGGAGTDTVRSGINWTLAADVENLVLTSAAAGTGNALNNTITGSGSADTLDGGAGNDVLSGGGGSDVLIVDSLSDTAVGGTGTDTVWASVNWTLGSDVERLLLTGAGTINGTGNALANVLTGNGGNNTLNGMDGDDTLAGGGGADTLIGGLGNDTFMITSLSDIVVDSSGTNILHVSVDNYNSTANAATIVQMKLVGAGQVLHGNALNNFLFAEFTGAVDCVIYGEGGDDTIQGYGGDDTLIGGAGNDSLDGGMGNDVLYGTDNDVLYDLVDGDDIFYIDSAGVTLNTGTGTGYDTIYSSVSFTLTTGIEKLVLTGGNINAQATSGDDVTIIGSSGNNTIAGWSGDDVLIGGDGNDRITDFDGTNTLSGGRGVDTLTGGSGNDYFEVLAQNMSPDVADADIINSFNVLEDVILLNLPDYAGPVSDYVDVVSSGGNSLVYADLDGTGTGSTMTLVAQINGFSGQNEQTLLASGHLQIVSYTP